MLRRNPFYFKAWTVRQRETSARRLRFVVVFFVLLHGPGMVSSLIPDFSQEGFVQRRLLCAGGVVVIWLGLAMYLALAAAQSFSRDRTLGTLDLIALTCVSPRREAWGRYACVLTDLFENWLLGAVAVVAACAVTHRLELAVTWLFALLWACGMCAFATLCSACEDEQSSATGLFLAALVVVNVVGFVSRSAVPGIWLLTPLSFGGLATLGSYGQIHDVAFANTPGGVETFLIPIATSSWLLVFSWCAFILCCLLAAERQVARQAPLRKARGPLAGTETVGGDSTPEPLSCARIVPVRNRIFEWLTSTFAKNPFYLKYLRGQEPATYGYGYVTTVVSVASLVVPFMCHTSVLFAIVAISFTQALLMAHQTLADERARSTWTTLAVTGIRPDTIVGGKFATVFHALHPEWVLAALAWLAMATYLHHPSYLLLATLTPAAVTLGIFVGLYLASQPRFLVIDVKRTLCRLALLGAGVWAAFHVNERTGAFFTLLNPTDMLYNLAASAYLSSSCGGPDATLGIYQFFTQAGLAGAIICTLWHATRRRLDLVLRGE